MIFDEYKRFITTLFRTLPVWEENLTPEDIKKDRTEFMDAQDWMFDHECFISDYQGDEHD